MAVQKAEWKAATTVVTMVVPKAEPLAALMVAH